MKLSRTAVAVLSSVAFATASITSVAAQEAANQPAGTPGESTSCESAPSFTGGMGWSYRPSTLRYTQGDIARGQVDTEEDTQFAPKSGPFTFTVDPAKTSIESPTKATFGLKGGFALKGHYDRDLYNGFAMNQQVRDLKLVVDGTSGKIIADYVSQNVDFSTMLVTGQVSGDDKVIANVTFEQAPNFDADTVELTGASTLAADGVALLIDYYPEGTELSPVMLKVTKGDRCDDAVTPEAFPANDKPADDDDNGDPSNSGPTGPGIDPATLPEQCRVSVRGQLDWAFKSTTTRYVQADKDGRITLNDGAAFTPDDAYFHFAVDPKRSVIDTADTSHAKVAADGAFRWMMAWHDAGYYIMDHEYSNPYIVFNGDTAEVYADIREPTDDSEIRDFKGVKLTNLQLEAPVDFTKPQTINATSKLSLYGSIVLQGYYSEGDEADPVTLTTTPVVVCDGNTPEIPAPDTKFEKIENHEPFPDVDPPSDANKNMEYPRTPRTDDRIGDFETTWGDKTNDGLPPNYAADQHDDDAVFYPDNTLGLNWKISDNFKPGTFATPTKGTRINDGTFTFPLKANGVRDEGAVISQYVGEVLFQSGCDESSETPKDCATEIKVSNPRLEFSTNSGTGNVFLWVSKKDPSTGEFSEAKSYAIGLVDGVDGKVNRVDNVVTWDNLTISPIPTTKDMLADLFTSEFAPAPLNMSYAHDAIVLAAAKDSGFGTFDTSINPVTVGDATAETPVMIKDRESKADEPGDQPETKTSGSSLGFFDMIIDWIRNVMPTLFGWLSNLFAPFSS